ncbi:unnamed protein product [marine sediment metagenome]|uniref:Uncharacterized protein n=1 Tax=marine sediment metagenome TaxID=412755 RepID=X1ICX3_9ZZZZ
MARFPQKEAERAYKADVIQMLPIFIAIGIEKIFGNLNPDTSRISNLPNLNSLQDFKDKEEI